MTPTYPNIHDRARALSHSKGVSLTAAYAELAKRSGAARAARSARRKRSLGTMQVHLRRLRRREWRGFLLSACLVALS